MTSSTALTLDTVVVATDEHVSSTLEDEEVILDLASGTYYGLNAVGRRIWSHIQSPHPVRVVCDRLEAEFDVDRDRIERDVLALLEDMRQEQLIRIEDA